MVKLAIMSKDTLKKTIRVLPLTEENDDNGLKQTNPTERWMMMWQLALDAWVFKGERQIVESRLPRHIIRVLRRTS